MSPPGGWWDVTSRRCCPLPVPSPWCCSISIPLDPQRNRGGALELWSSVVASSRVAFGGHRCRCHRPRPTRPLQVPPRPPSAQLLFPMSSNEEMEPTPTTLGTWWDLLDHSQSLGDLMGPSGPSQRPWGPGGTFWINLRALETWWNFLDHSRRNPGDLVGSSGPS